jgi:hypothetical protein
MHVKGLISLWSLTISVGYLPSSNHVGIKCLEASSCWLNDSWNAAIPPMIPIAMNIREIIDQITPQHWEDPPYLLAKTLASEVFTLRRIKSSHYVGGIVSHGLLWGQHALLQYPRRCREQTSHRRRAIREEFRRWPRSV